METTMKAAFLPGNSTVILKDVPVPEPNHGEVLIRIKSPLDKYVSNPVALMALVPGETYKPEIWETYRAICKKQEYFTEFESVERFAFYERAKKAYAAIATSETALYANIILKKGVVI